MKPAAKSPEFEKHDPLSRRLPGEPYWTAMARDHLAPFLPDLYACALLRQWSQFDAVVANLKARMNSVEPRPHKDQEHAWASRAKAFEMREWRREHMATKPVSGRVNMTGPEMRVDAGTQPDPRVADLIAAAARASELFGDDDLEQSAADPTKRYSIDTSGPITVTHLPPSPTDVEIVCRVCDGVVYQTEPGSFMACGAPTCPFRDHSTSSPFS